MGYRSYTAAEYRAAGINAGPYALEQNPSHNYRETRRKPILGVVMHITVGPEDYTPPDSSAEATTKYGMSMTRDASWHVCIDSDGIIPSVRDEFVAWHAGVADIPNVNDATLGIEQGKNTTNWNAPPDWWVESILRNVAVWLAPRVKKYGIPLVVLRDRDELDAAIRAGRKFGFVAHATVAPSNRTDPGIYQGRDTYPWARLFDMIREELAGDVPTSPEEDDMAYSESDLTRIVRNAVFGNTFPGASDARFDDVVVATWRAARDAADLDPAELEQLASAVVAKFDQPDVNITAEEVAREIVRQLQPGA